MSSGRGSVSRCNACGKVSFICSIIYRSVALLLGSNLLKAAVIVIRSDPKRDCPMWVNCVAAASRR